MEAEKRWKKGKKRGKKGNQEHDDSDENDDDNDDDNNNNGDDDGNDNDNGVKVKYSAPDWYQIMNAFETMADCKLIPNLESSDGGVG